MTFAEAVILAPDNAEYKAMLVQSLSGRQIFPQYDENIKRAIILCLEEDNIFHLPLFFSWHSLLLLDPATKILSDLQDCPDYETFLDILESHDISDTLNDNFLHQGLNKLLMKDYNFERLLTHLRRYALLEASPDQLQEMAPFLAALSAQCFFNEYIFYVTKEEQERINTISSSPNVPDPVNIIILSCYQPLYGMDKTEDLAHILKQSRISSAEGLIQIQITEPIEEAQIKKNIESFGSIADNTSKAVQEQYEENPFPRWSSCGGQREDNKKKLSAGKKVLVAGCGTGQQAVITSMNFPEADIIAIDLSKASLAYAQRKTKEYGLTNLTFMHGDILEVGDIGIEFDHIACGGVLHHMKSPKDGFQALKNILKKDGVMRIGVYSESARKNIVAVQNWIINQKIPSTLKGIRNFRKEFVEGGYKEIFGDTLPYFDNFSVSETRDLFFHVQEHRFTCLGLKELLNDMEMDLLIFAPEAYAVHQRFPQLFPDDPKALNLENWHIIEQKNPGLFIGMYKFYICHEGQHEPGTTPKWLEM